MSDVELAEMVATRTAERLDAYWGEKIERLQTEWRRELSRLRDDLTVKGLSHSDNCSFECPYRDKMTTTAVSAKVLIADDYDAMRRTLQRVLDQAGFLTIEA